MATKINPDFYGAENTFVTITTDIAKKSAYTLANLFSNDIYTGGSFDFTASPWGIGKSSISSDYQAQATKGAMWTIYSNENAKKNTPIWFYNSEFTITGGDRPEEITGSSATASRFARMLYKNRTSPNVVLSGTDFKSTNSIDNDITISVPDMNTITPVTFLDYSKTRVCLNNVYYKVSGNPYFGSTSFANFAEGGVTTDAIFGFDFTIRDIYGNVLNVYASIGGGELPIPDYYKTCYYGDDASSWVRPWRRIQSVGYWSIPNLAWREFNSSMDCINTADMETLNANDNATTNMGSNGWGHSSKTLQTFDNVSYHWEMGFTPRVSSNWWDISKLQTGDTYTSGLFRSFAYMTIDDGTADYESLTKAILHEIAFLGLPFCFSTAKATSAIGSDDIYLPVFDEHLITTGEYKNGSASLDLPNAAWTDIFGDEMPEYDPDYDPDAPPGPDDDEGDLTNLGANRQPALLNVLTFYAMNYLEFVHFMQELNNYYNGRSPEDWTIDFQGVNPSEYILGAYYTWFDLPINDIDVPVTIGRITLPTSTSRKLGYGDTTLRPNRWQYLTFGTRQIPQRYNDFRDYPPYTTIELYLPLAGTIELDAAYVMGHSITVSYYYSILTMTGVACVYRDDLIYKTVDLQIASQIPLLSTNIGQYQNQIAQLESARKQNSIRMTTGALSTAIGIGATIATGGAALPALLATGAGIATATTGALKQAELDYQLTHIAPSLSVTGAAESSNNLCCGQLVPKLIIKRAKKLKTLNDTIYSETVGNACCINDYIGSRTGLVVCSNINTKDIVNAYGESPTADEINAIKQAFANGVYV